MITGLVEVFAHEPNCQVPVAILSIEDRRERNGCPETFSIMTDLSISSHFFMIGVSQTRMSIFPPQPRSHQDQRSWGYPQGVLTGQGDHGMRVYAILYPQWEPNRS
jgi:hypothetical protein